MPSTRTDSSTASLPKRDGRRHWLGGFLAAAALASGVAVVYGYVHEGKSFAIEAAVPQLELEENPFSLREAWWNGELEPGETKIIQHQLFKRNEYWFWLGASVPGSKVNIHCYDSDGRLADAESWQDRHVAAARIVPKKTGVHYIRIAIEEAPAKPVPWAVVYGYR